MTTSAQRLPSPSLLRRYLGRYRPPRHILTVLVERGPNFSCQPAGRSAEPRSLWSASGLRGCVALCRHLVAHQMVREPRALWLYPAFALPRPARPGPAKPPASPAQPRTAPPANSGGELRPSNFHNSTGQRSEDAPHRREDHLSRLLGEEGMRDDPARPGPARLASRQRAPAPWNTPKKAIRRGGRAAGG